MPSRSRCPPFHPPSFAPSFAPTLAPTLTRSRLPSFAPSLTRSRSPSFAPSLAPSPSPVRVLVRASIGKRRTRESSSRMGIHSLIGKFVYPSHVLATFTNFPTRLFSPSSFLAIALVPSRSPHRSHSFAPSLAPTLAPFRPRSFALTLAPSHLPPFAPSFAPTIAPFFPTLSPTYSPSLVRVHPRTGLAPSFSPSFARALPFVPAPSYIFFTAKFSSPLTLIKIQYTRPTWEARRGERMRSR